MPKPLNNIHDKFVKDMLSDKELAIAFLEEMLPESVASLIAFDTLIYSDKTYITPELEELFSDMLLDFTLKSGNSLQVTVLIEHKSYIDKHTPIQILRYLAEGYHKQTLAKEPLRPIFPLLYYHGKKKWSFKQFENLFEDYLEPFSSFLPLYKSAFVSLVEMEENDLAKLRNSMLHAALETQRHHTDPDALMRRLRHITENLNPYLNSEFAIKIVLYLLQTTEVSMEVFKHHLPEPIISKVMSTYDRIIEKGIEQGIVKAILNAFDNGIDLKTIQIITGESINKITDILKQNGRVVG